MVKPQRGIICTQGDAPTSTDSNDGQLSFDSFEILAVLSTANPLLGSQGLEYEVDDEFRCLDPKERLRRQRLNLKKQLGLDTGGGSDDVVRYFYADQFHRTPRMRTARIVDTRNPPALVWVCVGGTHSN